MEKLIEQQLELNKICELYDITPITEFYFNDFVKFISVLKKINLKDNLSSHDDNGDRVFTVECNGINLICKMNKNEVFKKIGFKSNET